MNRPVARKIALALFALMPALSLSAPARASDTTPSIAAQGTWVDCNIVTDMRKVGALQKITVNISQTFVGMLSGGYVGTEYGVVYADGNATFRGSGTFTGTVNGKKGRAVFSYSGTVNAQGSGSATWALDKGADELKNLRGQGTFSAAVVPPQQSPYTPTDPSVCDGGMYGGGYNGTLRFMPE